MAKKQKKVHPKDTLPFAGVAALLVVIIILIVFPLQEKAQLIPNEKQQSLPEKEREYPGRVVRIEEGNAPVMEISASVSHQVSILGRKGFSPSEVRANGGDVISWTNNDAEGKEVTLVFQKPREVNKFITSPIIKLEEEWTYTFEQSGEYTYWTVGYGTKGKVIVR